MNFLKIVILELCLRSGTKPPLTNCFSPTRSSIWSVNPAFFSTTLPAICSFQCRTTSEHGDVFWPFTYWMSFLDSTDSVSQWRFLLSVTFSWFSIRGSNVKEWRQLSIVSSDCPSSFQLQWPFLFSFRFRIMSTDRSIVASEDLKPFSIPSIQIRSPQVLISSSIVRKAGPFYKWSCFLDVILKRC